PSLTHLAVSDALRDGRIPRAQKVRSESQNVLRAREIKRRKLLQPKTAPVGKAENVVVKGFQFESRRSSKPADEFRYQSLPLSSMRPSQNSESLLFIRFAKPVQLADNFG